MFSEAMRSIMKKRGPFMTIASAPRSVLSRSALMADHCAPGQSFKPSVL